MDTGAPDGTGSARNYVNQPSSLRFDVHQTNSPGQFHVRLGDNTVGYVNEYPDPQHGRLYSATFHPKVLAMATHLSPTRKGFVSKVDAANHIADNCRDIAQIENIGGWRA
jgi:hypothetical protein